MNIKLVTMGLVGLGVVAAICAAVLVASMQDTAVDQQKAAPEQDVNVVVASRDLPAMTMLSDGDVVTRTVKRSLAPAAAYGDAVQVIGKVLTSPLSSGQAVTADAFTTDGSPMRLAASLPPGQRAVTITLDDRMGGTELLYPGCLVDVLATMRMAMRGGSDQPVTITLLQGITVLAIAGQTVVAPAGSEQSQQQQQANPRRTVTMLVESRQSEMVKLALEEGSVSLVLRNPHDLARPAAGGTDLAALSPILQMQQPTAAGEPPAPLPPNIQVPRPLQHTWDTIVLRGGAAETRSFELPTSSQP